MVQLLLGLLSVLLLYFLFFFVLDLLANKGNWGGGNYLISGTIGLITDFLDTLGIGSFAPTTMLLEFTKQLDNDRQLPGTLNVAHSIPVIIEAFIFITVVKVSPITLFSLVAAAIVGSFVGSKTVSIYAVGPTLGGGTAALLDSAGNIVYPYCYESYEILDNGPLRFTVSLRYAPLSVDGDSAVIEERMISLDKGSWLNRTSVTYTGLRHDVCVAPGIVIHRQNPEGYTLANGYMSYADSTENSANGNGVIFVGVVSSRK